MKPVLLVLCLLLLFICLACRQTALGDSTFANSDNNSNGSEIQSLNAAGENKGRILLEVAQTTKEKVTFKLSNFKDKPIFFPNESHPSLETEKRIVAYGIKCKENKAKEFIDHTTESHMLPPLSPLPAGTSISFDVDEFPENARGEINCILNLGYYEDERAVGLIKNKWFDLSKEEMEFIEQAKRRIKFSFNH